MTFLEPVLAAAIGAGITALTLFLNKNKTAQLFLKYGPIVNKAYDIIDPILDQNLHNWKGSQVDKAFELAIESVADGKLTTEEVKQLAFHMAKAWLPQVAADKVRRLEAAPSPAPQLLAAAEVAKKVSTLVR
jgi:hypothetical protein